LRINSQPLFLRQFLTSKMKGRIKSLKYYNVKREHSPNKRSTESRFCQHDAEGGY